jgi:HAD superfamily hydrolase (TIGR01549 family)
VLKEKKALLLDMNSTFMFGEDRFGENEDFSIYYKKIGGALKKKELNHIIMSAYEYLDIRYPDEKYRHNFPSLKTAIEKSLVVEITEEEIEKIIDTFAFHELGQIPQEFVAALHKLKERFILAVVIDIWSPKKPWIEAFEKAGISKLFSASSFSSDHGMVKPSHKPFELVVGHLNLRKEECLVVGDSERRDLGGAMAAGIDCVLVGGASSLNAAGCYSNLLAFTNEIL